MAVRIRLHRAAIAELLYSPTGDVYGLVNRTTRAVEGEVIAEAPIVTGAMVNSIRSDIDVHVGRSVTGRVTSDDEAALWVNTGTGIHGPTRTRIRPTRSSVLRWPNRRGPGFVYRDSVAGQEANDFFWRGLRQGTAFGTQRWTLTRYIR